MSTSFNSFYSVISSFSNHFIWSIKNYSHYKFSYSDKIKIKKEDFSKELWETIVKCENVYLKAHKKPEIEIKKEDNHSYIYKILSFFGIGLSPQDALIKKINDGIAEGYCFGISSALVKQTPPTGKSSIDKTDIAIFQALQDMYASAKEIAETNNDLKKEAINAYTEAEQSISDRLDRIWEASSTYNSIKDLKKGLSSLKNGKILINIIPTSGVDGHSVFIDLDSNSFFDTNAGFYRYKSKEQLVKNTSERLNGVYINYFKNPRFSVQYTQKPSE